MSVGLHRRPVARAMQRARARSDAMNVVEERGVPMQYIGLTTRAVAFIIDALIIDAVAIVGAAATALAFSILNVPSESRTVAIAVGALAFILWAFGYFVAFWSMTGQTPGSRVMRIKVCDVSGDGLLPRRAVLRFVGLTLAAIPLFLGFVPILFTQRRRGLHDWIARSVVVDYADDATVRKRSRED